MTTDPHGNYSLTWLPDILRKAGLKVVEQPAWQTRGHGDVKKIMGVLCHHTASQMGKNAPDLKTVTFGRSDLAGPLAQLLLARDGTFYMVAAGKCWHAGPGAIWDVPLNAGNDYLIGIEAENNGIGEPWPDKQMAAFAKGCAAMLDYLKLGRDRVAGHKEYAKPKGRKIDPSFPMADFRQSVTKIKF